MHDGFASNSQKTTSSKAWISANAFDRYSNERDIFLRCTSVGRNIGSLLRSSEQTPDYGIEASATDSQRKFHAQPTKKIMLNGSGIHERPYWKGPILVHCQERAIMADSSPYCKIYKRLKPVIQSERQGLLWKCVLLSHKYSSP